MAARHGANQRPYYLVAERAGFEPAIPGYGIPLFESGAFSHSATSPEGGFEYISDPRVFQTAFESAATAKRPTNRRIEGPFQLDTPRKPYLLWMQLFRN